VTIPQQEPVSPAPGEAAEPPTPRDAAFWAKDVARLHLGEVPAEAVNLNVTGRRVVGPVQGFGKMWQKTYRVELTGAGVTPAEVIAAWKADFQSFWPTGNRFYGPLTGIAPGEVALLNLDMPGRLRLSTGVLVLYADDESFTFMTPQGHMFAAWITFSAVEEGGVVCVQAQVLLRANDPVYEAALAFGGHRKEDLFWQQTLAAVARRFGVGDPEVATTVVCVDRRRQWAHAGNVWHNAAIRSGLWVAGSPLRLAARPFRRPPAP
jgi:hypothetical protein